MARRGENIRKRSDGRWEGRYIKGRSADGKPCWGYVYGATYTEVREISARKKAEYGIYNLNSTDITFSEISEQWLYSVRHGVKESTFSHYQYTLRHYLQPVFGDFKVSALSEKILEQGLLAVITPANGKQKPLGATMAQECLSMLRRICKYAAHFHLIRPLEIMVKLPQKSPKVLLPFTTEEQKKLQSFVMDAPTPRKIGLLLGFQLGLRIGEICGLKWGDFDLSAGTVTIQRTVTRISCGNGHTKVIVQYVTKDFGFLRGEIYYADLDPHYGSEQGGKRPVIVIQNNTGNKFAPTVIVAAVTSKVTKKPNQPTHVLIDRNPAFSRPSMVLLEQIFTIDKERIQRLLGQTTPGEMYQINEALMNSLDLNGGRLSICVFLMEKHDARALTAPNIYGSQNFVAAAVLPTAFSTGAN